MSGGEMPRRMALLPQDKAGHPVPWFVAFIDGVPDFRVVKPGAVRDALRCSLCWVCGRGFSGGEDRAFVLGPVCAVNRVSAEPPSHAGCATWSAENCPFLATPQMTRRERHMPEGTAEPPAIMLRRNPGVALVWVTGYRSWTTRRAGRGLLFGIGDPKRALWFACGREATRAEVLASVDSGLPVLREMAEEEGPGAVAALDRMHREALAHIPPEVKAS
jgi:hypothetical protein